MIGDILQPTHLLFVLIVALLVLGPKRLPEAGRALGKGIKDFRTAINGDEHTPGLMSEMGLNSSPPAPTAVAPPPVTEPAPPSPVPEMAVPVMEPAAMPLEPLEPPTAHAEPATEHAAPPTEPAHTAG